MAHHTGRGGGGRDARRRARALRRGRRLPPPHGLPDRERPASQQGFAPPSTPNTPLLRPSGYGSTTLLRGGSLFALPAAPPPPRSLSNPPPTTRRRRRRHPHHPTAPQQVKVPGVTEAENDRFLDTMEAYFSRPDDLKMRDARPEFSYQVGATPSRVEAPRCLVDPRVRAAMAALRPGHEAADVTGAGAGGRARSEGGVSCVFAEPVMLAATCAHSHLTHAQHAPQTTKNAICAREITHKRQTSSGASSGASASAPPTPAPTRSCTRRRSCPR